MYDIFDRFHPRIIDVFHRDPEFWNRGKSIESRRTRLLSLIYVYDGQGTLELNDSRFSLKKGCVFQIPVGRNLILDSSASRPLCYYTVQYDFRLVEWEGAAVRCEDPADKVLPFDLVLPMPDTEVMRTDMQRLYTIWTKKKQGFHGKAKLAFLNILHHVSEQQDRQKEEDPMELLIQDCVKYIHCHYEKPLEREALARIASLSSSYFSVMFKKYTGCSPVQFITRVRLDHAMRLLRESGKSVACIALEVGFRDPLYFTRVFSRDIGVSPTEYRSG